MIDLRRHLPISLVAERLMVAPATVRRWVRTGKLAGIRRGGVVLIHPDDVAKFIQPAVAAARPAVGDEGEAAAALRNLGVG